MINKLSIKGFKSISNLEINCKKLNLITGMNSSGKSTVLQSILIAAQNRQSNVGLNGPYISVGDFKDAKNFNVAEKLISLDISFPHNDSVGIVFDQNGVKENGFYIQDMKLFGTPEDFLTVSYLSCNRIGAEDIYKKNFVDEKNIGVNGEYAIYCLDKNKSVNLPQELVKDYNSYTLISQVNYWLNYILNSSITTEDVVGTDYVKCFYTNDQGKQVRPKNTGAGLSYLISIIVMCLLSKKGDIIIIENPEIHLHPNAQAKVCEFLYFVSNADRQLFVETHSDHVFNGIRAGIATQTMNGNEIAVNFFSLDSRNCTKNNVIEFGKRGRILNCVDGLFDQFDIDLNRMLEI